MLIRALCEYYEILRQKGAVLPDGYSRVSISYLICLTAEGRIADITDCRVTDASEEKPKPQPREMLFPRRTEKTGIGENFIEHRPIYLFGLMYDKASDRLVDTDSTGKAQKSHALFVRYNLEAIREIDEPLVNAYRAFLKTWKPAEERENPLLAPLRKQIGSGAYFAFCLDGSPTRLLQDVPEIRARWEEMRRHMDNGAVQGQCAITGEEGSIARLHRKLMGVYGGQASGTALVSFNNESEESYGATQSYNSHISDAAMRRYTEALGNLLASRKHTLLLDDMTVLHWAASPDDGHDRLFSDCMAGANRVTETLDRLLQNARDGTPPANMSAALSPLDPTVPFYTAILKPNGPRLAVKFFYRGTFAEMLLNVARHMEDMKLGTASRPVPLWRMKNQLVSPWSRNEKADPALIATLFGAVVQGTAYPEWLLSTLLRRIRTDGHIDPRDDEIRMRMLKACLNRKARLNGQEEVIPIALDKTRNSPAYLCGRLFSVLESIQQKALNDRLHRTIRDVYFADTSVRPAAVFPKLIALSQYHLSKLDKSCYADREVADILARLGNAFPSILSLTEQGVFMLGYCQQKADTQQKIKQRRERKQNGHRETL